MHRRVLENMVYKKLIIIPWYYIHAFIFAIMFCYHSSKIFLFNITTGLWVYDSLTVSTTAL
jgi:hypothetical protein